MENFVINLDQFGDLNNLNPDKTLDIYNFIKQTIKSRIENKEIKLKKNIKILKIADVNYISYNIFNNVNKVNNIRLFNIEYNTLLGINYFSIKIQYYIDIDNNNFIFYNDYFNIKDYNLNVKIKNINYYYVSINNITLYKFNRVNGNCNLGNPDKYLFKKIKELKLFIYNEIDYTKLFLMSFVLKKYAYEESNINIIMPIEYIEQTNIINNIMKFKNKSEAFKNPNSENHLIYYWEQAKTFLTK